MSLPHLKSLLLSDDPAFWLALRDWSRSATALEELIAAATLRKKALLRRVPGAPERKPLRVALAGGCSLYPYSEILLHLLAVEGVEVELCAGAFDNYVAELSDPESALHTFHPQALVLLPGEQRLASSGLAAPREQVQHEAIHAAEHLLGLCRGFHARTAAEIVLANFSLPSAMDPGAFRSRAAGSEWNFRKLVNLELGLNAPPCVRILDREYLSAHRGTAEAADPRRWFESKQPGSPDFIATLARETAQLLLARPPKKLLAVDLDNTLWGGVIADDGLEGIELGDTSPRGEAFKAFQREIRALKERGVLLAVCSKNNPERALEVFEKHPEMVLRAEDFVSFKANWEPKADNLRSMALELRIGLDTFVFIDDNPAEIEIVRQFAPEVTTILLGPDPALYAAQLRDCRLFEPQQLTVEDRERTAQYLSEAQREQLRAGAVDMASYLRSLEMRGTLSPFTPVDAPRVAQLIQRSNQFNLTTRRRTESEVLALVGSEHHLAFSVRLADRFGDHGLISIIIGEVADGTCVIDTWLMSCRVLQRGVEDLALNELARLAKSRGCKRLLGIYLPTPKNAMVRDFYPRMGFTAVAESPERSEYALDLTTFTPHPVTIST